MNGLLSGIGNMIRNEKKEFHKIWGDRFFTCWNCMTQYNCFSAVWVYNDRVYKKLIACPNCKSQVMVNR